MQQTMHVLHCPFVAASQSGIVSFFVVVFYNMFISLPLILKTKLGRQEECARELGNNTEILLTQGIAS